MKSDFSRRESATFSELMIAACFKLAEHPCFTIANQESKLQQAVNNRHQEKSVVIVCGGPQNIVGKALLKALANRLLYKCLSEHYILRIESLFKKKILLSALLENGI